MPQKILFLFSLSILLAFVTPAFGQTLDETPVPILPPVAAEPEKAPEPEALVTLSFDGEAGVSFVDNIYRSPSNEESDEIAIFAPEVVLRSNMDTHQFKVRGNVERGQYFSETQNNYTDASLGGEERYAINETLALLARGRYRYDHVPVGAFVDDPDRLLTEPTTYRVATLGAGLDKRAGLLRFEPDVTWYDYNYDNTPRQDGTTAINDDRDREEWEGSLRGGYYVRPDLLAYVKGIANTHDYNEMVDISAVYPLDSDGYTVLLGLEQGERSKSDVWYNAGIGYLDQDYDSSFREDLSGLAFDAQGYWRVNPLLTLTGLLNRSAQDSTLSGGSGYYMTRAAAGAQYLLTPEWTLGADLRYTNYDFKNNPTVRPDREDDVYDGSALVQYNITEHYNVGLEYGYSKRNSDDPTVEFDQNTVFARFKADY